MKTKLLLEQLYEEEVQLLKALLENVIPRTQNGYLKTASASFLVAFQDKHELILKKYLNGNDIWSVGKDNDMSLLLNIEYLSELLKDLYLAALPLLNATLGKPDQRMVSKLNKEIDKAKNLIDPPACMSPDETDIYNSMQLSLKTLEENNLIFGEETHDKWIKLFDISSNYRGNFDNTWRKRPDERQSLLIEFILKAARERATFCGFFQAKNAQTSTLKVFYQSLTPCARKLVFDILSIPENEHTEIKDFIKFSEYVNNYRNLIKDEDNLAMNI